MKISIPRAGYSGTFAEFAEENTAFIPENEMHRLHKELLNNGKATHKAHTAGDFEIVVVK